MFGFRNNLFAIVKRGFTLIEVMMAVAILGVILASAMLVANRSIEAMIDVRTRGRAFEVARENMELVMAGDYVEQFAEFGMSEMYPEIEYELIVEPFYEPVNNRMWIQAKSTAAYMDREGESQDVTLTCWVTNLTKKQITQILEQMKREEDFAERMQKQFEDYTPEELYELMQNSVMGGDMEMANWYGNVLSWHFPDSAQAGQITDVIPDFEPSIDPPEPPTNPDDPLGPGGGDDSTDNGNEPTDEPDPFCDDWCQRSEQQLINDFGPQMGKMIQGMCEMFCQ